MRNRDLSWISGKSRFYRQKCGDSEDMGYLATLLPFNTVPLTYCLRIVIGHVRIGSFYLGHQRFPKLRPWEQKYHLKEERKSFSFYWPFDPRRVAENRAPGCSGKKNAGVLLMGISMEGTTIDTGTSAINHLLVFVERSVRFDRSWNIQWALRCSILVTLPSPTLREDSLSKWNLGVLSLSLGWFLNWDESERASSKIDHILIVAWNDRLQYSAWPS